MPSSKRSRVIPTSKTTKNRKELVRRLHANIQSCCLQYSYIYVFSIENTRNNLIKAVRAEFNDSRFVMGKTKVMIVALGRDEATECVPGVSKLTEYLSGEVGLLFTDRPRDEVEGYFEGYSELDFARQGAVASKEVIIPHGEMRTQYGVEGGEDDPLPVQIESQLRKLGVPSRIRGGKVVLEDKPDEVQGGMEGLVDNDGEDGYVVCREGDVLDSRQTSILKILGVRMSEFRIGLRAVFEKGSGEVRELGGMDVDEDGA